MVGSPSSSPAKEGLYEQLITPSVSLKAMSPRSGNSVRLLTCFVPLIALVGMGAHFSKNALAPAQPVLEEMGLSPVLYAVIYATPTVGAIVFPTLWGFAYVQAERLVVMTVPLGLLFAQTVLVSGFMLHNGAEAGASVSFPCKVLMSLGLLLLSLFRAGAEVIQHTLLAKVMPTGSIIGFVILVFCTHTSVVICNLVVPRALMAASTPWLGVIFVQLIFIIPSILGCGAAFVLCNTHMQDDVAVFTKEESEQAMSTGRTRNVNLASAISSERPSSAPIAEEMVVSSTLSNRARRQTNAFLLLWAGSMVGLLHAFQSITSKFIVNLGYSVTEAGDITARNQFIALCAMPIMGALGHYVPKRLLMVGMTLLTLLASAALCTVLHASEPAELLWLWQAALLALALVGVFAPVLSLAMIPEYVQEPGKAYGVLDSIKSFAQASLVLVLGRLREDGGFELATTFVVECFVTILALAICAAWRPAARRPA